MVLCRNKFTVKTRLLDDIIMIGLVQKLFHWNNYEKIIFIGNNLRAFFQIFHFKKKKRLSKLLSFNVNRYILKLLKLKIIFECIVKHFETCPTSHFVQFSSYSQNASDRFYIFFFFFSNKKNILSCLRCSFVFKYIVLFISTFYITLLLYYKIQNL